MNTTATRFSSSEINSLLKLAIPLILNGFLEASIGFSTTFFLAHLGARELAAGAVVQWIFFTMMVILWGTLCSVSVLVSQKFGEKNYSAISDVLRDSIILALIMTVPTMLLLRNMEPILLVIGQSAVTAELGSAYMKALSWGMAPDFIMLVLMQFFIGLGHARTTLFFTLCWVPINIISSYAFVFGKFGLPALGMEGIGWGTSFAFTLVATILIIYLLFNSYYRKYLSEAFAWGKPKYLWELCQIGVPMGSMFCIEVGFFLTMTLVMAHWGTEIVAANQITLQLSGQISVVSFSIAQAITVRIGHTLGANQPHLAERAAYIGMAFALSFMMLVAISWWLVPKYYIGIDLDLAASKNAKIISYAIEFLAIGAFFQLIESVRFTLFGALRGMKDTRFTLLTSIISFWGISLPLGYLLATVFHLSGSGLWYGVVLGQFCGALILYARFRYKVRAMYHYAAFAT